MEEIANYMEFEISDKVVVNRDLIRFSGGVFDMNGRTGIIMRMSVYPTCLITVKFLDSTGKSLFLFSPEELLLISRKAELR